MPKDFAARGGTSTRKQPRRPAKKRTPKQRVLFHGPSFSSGALVGAAIVILAAYAPELLRDTEREPDAVEAATADEPRALSYEFAEILRETEVQPDPDTYKVPDPVEETFWIQAGSFRTMAQAESLRARLLIKNLPARTEEGGSDGTTWYRVIVGPFPRKLYANRAMTTLRREENLNPMWLPNQD